MEDQDAAPRAVKGQLDGGKPPRRKVRVAAARAYRVQVERQLEARAGDGDRFGECHHIHQPRHQVQHALVVAQRQPVGPPRRLQHGRVAQVLGRLERPRALALGTAPVHRVPHGPLQARLERHRIGGGRRRIGQAN